MIIRFSVAVMLLFAQVLTAAAHISELPHPHPHLMEATAGQGPIVLMLLIVSALLFGFARRHLNGRPRQDKDVGGTQ